MTRLLTFPLRSSARGGRALAMLFCAMLALSASCGADYAPLIDGPTTPALAPGSFVLAAVEGKVLPYNVPNTQVPIAIIAGDCVTTSQAFTLNLTTATGTAAPVTTKTDGFVLDVNRGSVLFHFSSSSIQAPVTITGNGFQMTYLDLLLTFERVG